MEALPGSAWQDILWMYSPNMKEIFNSKVAQVLSSKGENVTHKDFNHFDLIHAGEHEGIEKLVSTYNLKAPLKALEIGAGFGGTARHLCCEHGFEVDGIEYLEHLVECCSELNSRIGLTEKMSITHGDICEYPLPSNHYDLAYATVVFIHISDTRGIQNVARSLKPGGLFYLEDYYFDKPREDWDENDVLLANERGMCGVRTKEEYRRVFDEAGLDVVEEDDYGAHWSECVWQRAQDIIDEGIEKDTGVHSKYHQYVIISAQVSCNLRHMTVDEIKRKYPGVCKHFDVEDLVFNKRDFTGIWRLIGRKRAN